MPATFTSTTKGAVLATGVITVPSVVERLPGMIQQESIANHCGRSRPERFGQQFDRARGTAQAVNQQHTPKQIAQLNRAEVGKQLHGDAELTQVEREFPQVALLLRRNRQLIDGKREQTLPECMVEGQGLRALNAFG
ncbi:hypothetical protein [uncultured Rikenella sp.]|uniref:hypothetical protein n=1 Tax=uncultured Rikenella sp. TaxID=368003 RepID=UPI0025CE00D0|nr:hypothetical protein [uncultured Rikenella sp.]